MNDNVVIDVKNLNVPDGRPFKFDGFNGNTWVCGTKIETTGLKKILLQGNQDITEIRLQINNGINCNITVFNNLFNSILQLKIAKVNLFYEKTTI